MSLRTFRGEKSKKAALLAPRTPHEIIFTEQLPSGYAFHIQDFDSFVLSRVKRKGMFYYHEYFDPELPVKLYVDYERKGMKTEDEFAACELEVQEIVAKIKQKLYPYDAQCTLLDASSLKQEIVSVHMVFHNVWCQNTLAVKQFVMETGINVDTNVYRGGATLRFGYACKREEEGDGRPFIPRGASAVFTPQWFCRSLITVSKKHSNIYKNLLSDDPTEENILVKQQGPLYRVKRARLEPQHPLTEREVYVSNVVSKIKEWLTTFRVDVEFQDDEISGDNAQFYATPSLFCGNKGAVHKSNNTVVKVNVTGLHSVKVWLFCHDEQECSHRTRPCFYDFSLLSCGSDAVPVKRF